jgi:hypothetical protein
MGWSFLREPAKHEPGLSWQGGIPERAAEKLFRHSRVSMACVSGTRREYTRRMIKKAIQQGRSERRGEEVQTALRVGRSPVELILANGKSPTACRPPRNSTLSF